MTGVGTKVMVLGKKFEPEKDETYKTIVQVENKTKEIETKIKEISVEVLLFYCQAQT